LENRKKGEIERFIANTVKKSDNHSSHQLLLRQKVECNNADCLRRILLQKSKEAAKKLKWRYRH
jgi:hypothetical protein